jgi:hypothetical protein
MKNKKNTGSSGSKLPPALTEIGPAVAAIVLGAFLYFRESSVVWGIDIPDYTGLILAFVGIFWLFYTLFSPR